MSFGRSMFQTTYKLHHGNGYNNLCLASCMVMVSPRILYPQKKSEETVQRMEVEVS